MDRAGNRRGDLILWLCLEEKLTGIADTLHVEDERKRIRRDMGLRPKQLTGWARGR